MVQGAGMVDGGVVVGALDHALFLYGAVARKQA
jgi:hypothetical protein